MRKVLTSVLVLLVSALALKAQNVSDLIISEVLAQPDSTGILDDYGRRSGWVELYNKSTGTVNFGGCYLTDDRSALRKSPIPKSDLRTKLGPRQTVLLYCSGNGHDGTFYAGFTLAPGKTVYLVSNDGRTIIDSLQIPAGLPVGKSVIKLAEDIRQQNFETVHEPATPSPAIVNGDQNAATKGERMKERDPHGWILTVVSVSVVFCALAKRRKGPRSARQNESGLSHWAKAKNLPWRPPLPWRWTWSRAETGMPPLPQPCTCT